MTWIKILYHSWSKQANITPMPTHAPNYHPANTTEQTCDNCAFNDQSTNFCKKYQFTNDPTYVCDSWQTLDLNLYDKIAEYREKQSYAVNPLKVPPIPGLGNVGGGQTPGIPTPPTPSPTPFSNIQAPMSKKPMVQTPTNKKNPAVTQALLLQNPTAFPAPIKT